LRRFMGVTRKEQVPNTENVHDDGSSCLRRGMKRVAPPVKRAAWIPIDFPGLRRCGRA
jgi:hypothetical protein